MSVGLVGSGGPSEAGWMAESGQVRIKGQVGQLCPWARRVRCR